MPRYAHTIYNGYWWSPERLMLQALIDESQRHVNGTVRLKLYKGNVLVVGRRSTTDDLFDPAIATFEDDRGAYDQKDAEGFIRLNARAAAHRGAAREGVRRGGRPLIRFAEPGSARMTGFPEPLLDGYRSFQGLPLPARPRPLPPRSQSMGKGPRSW